MGKIEKAKVCVCVHACVRVRARVHTSEYLHVCAYAHMRAWWARVYVYLNVGVHLFDPFADLCMHVHVWADCHQVKALF